MQVLYEIPDLQRASPLGCVVLFTTACFEAKKVFVSMTSGLPVCPFMLSVLGVTGWNANATSTLVRIYPALSSER